MFIDETIAMFLDAGRFHRHCPKWSDRYHQSVSRLTPSSSSSTTQSGLHQLLPRRHPHPRNRPPGPHQSLSISRALGARMVSSSTGPVIVIVEAIVVVVVINAVGLRVAGVGETSTSDHHNRYRFRHTTPQHRGIPIVGASSSESVLYTPFVARVVGSARLSPSRSANITICGIQVVVLVTSSSLAVSHRLSLQDFGLAVSSQSFRQSRRDTSLSP